MKVREECIELIKRDGAVAALTNRIGILQFRLSNNWEHTRADDKFCRLGEAIDDAEEIVHQIRRLFEALQEIDIGHK